MQESKLRTAHGICDAAWMFINSQWFIGAGCWARE